MVLNNSCRFTVTHFFLSLNFSRIIEEGVRVSLVEIVRCQHLLFIGCGHCISTGAVPTLDWRLCVLSTLREEKQMQRRRILDF